MARAQRALLVGCFFISGATSLVLEVAWTKQLSYLLGNTLYAVSTVVAVYMGGLGLGALAAGKLGERLKRPVRAYALIQAGVGCMGMISIPFFRRMEPVFGWIFRAMEDSPGGFLAIRFMAVFILLISPVFLMGMTLPLLTGAMRRRGDSGDISAGTLYGANTLGAVAGTWAAGFTLLPALGLAMSCVVAGAADLAVAAAAFGLQRRLGSGGPSAPEPQPPPLGSSKKRKAAHPGGQQAPARWTGRQRVLAVLFMLSGFAAMACEVAWFRVVGLVAGPSTYAFSSLLAIFLIGIGAGSLAWVLGGRWISLRGLGTLAGLEILLGLAGIASLFMLNSLPAIYANWFTGLVPRGAGMAFYLSLAGICALLALAPCFFLGVIFPAALRALEETGPRRNGIEGVGYLYAANTFGAIFGSLCTGFWLLPGFGLWRTLSGASLLSLGVGLAALVLGGFKSPVRWTLGLVFALLAAVGLREAPPLNLTLFNMGGYRFLYQGNEAALGMESAESVRLVFFREGLLAPTAVFNILGDGSLRISGKADASTVLNELVTHVLLGHIPMMFAKTPRRAATIGFGSGATTGAISAYREVQRLDVVEIEPAVMEAAPFFKCISGEPLRDPRTRLYLQDAQIHLAYSGERYDVISAEPSNPWMAGISNLFTVDFYRRVQKRLEPGGVFCQWIQMYDISEEAFKGIVASLLDVFPYALAFRGGPADAILLAADEPIVVSWQDISERFNQPRVRSSLARIGVSDPCELAAHFRAGTSALRAYVKDTRQRNTDDNLWLEHKAIADLVRISEISSSQAALDATFVRLGDGDRLHALSGAIQGLPAQAFLEGSVRYYNRMDFAVDDQGVIRDTGLAERQVIEDGFRREVAEDGHLSKALAAALAKSHGDREKLLCATKVVFGELPDQPRVRFERLDEAMSGAQWWTPGLVAMGNTLAGAGFLKPAREYYRRALGQPYTPDYYFALLYLGRVEFDLSHAGEGNLEEALRLTRAAVDWNPYRPEGYVGLAEMALAQGKRGEAEEVLRRGLVYCPDDPLLKEVMEKVISGA